MNNPAHATRKAIFTLTLGAALLAATPLVTTPAQAKHGRERDNRRHHGTVIVPSRHRPVIVTSRPVRVVRAPRTVICADFVSTACRAPYVDARWIQVHGHRYYYNASFGLYVGGVALDFNLSDRAPRGWVYYDPVCDQEFWTIDAYRTHLHRHDHSGALTMLRVTLDD